MLTWTKLLALGVSSTLMDVLLGLLPPCRSYLLGIGAGLFVAGC